MWNVTSYRLVNVYTFGYLPNSRQKGYHFIQLARCTCGLLCEAQTLVGSSCPVIVCSENTEESYRKVDSAVNWEVTDRAVISPLPVLVAVFN
jgi:hypothetical protein